MAETLTARAPAPVRAFAVGGLVLAVLAVVLGLLLTGAASPTDLFDPGPAVRWGLPVVSVLVNLAAMLTVGAFALCVFALPRPRPAAAQPAARPAAQPAAHAPDPQTAARPARGAAVHGAAWRAAAGVGAVAAVCWALLQATHLLLTHASVTGTGIGGEQYGAQLAQFVTEIELGVSLAWAVLLTAVLAVAAVAVSGYASAAGAGVLALVALVPTALTGHSAGATSHELAVSAMWMHLVAVCLWAGGLVVLTLVARRTGPDLPDVVQRYSTLALWCVIVVAVSGTANAWIRLGAPGNLVASTWGQLLLIKLVLFALLAAAGWGHRRATIPALRASAAAHLEPARSWAFWRLAGVEVLIMGAVMGVSSALGSSAPPVPQEPVAEPSPVFDLTGYPAPPPPSVLTYLTQWRLDPLFASLAVAGIIVYLVWVVRLRRRGDAWSSWRTVAWVVGLVLFGWVTSGGPIVYGRLLFSAHMLQHMSLVMVLPIFFVLGAPVTLALRALPSRPDGSRGPREWLLAVVHSRWARLFAHPLVAAVNFAGSMVVFYYTPLFELALTTHVGHVLMVVHFSLAGYLFANVLIGIDPGAQRPPYPLRLLLLLATMAFHAFFGISIIASTSLLAADYFGWLGLPWWVDAMADQEAGGAITWGIGELPTLALAVAVALRWARDDERTARRSDRRAERDEDAELAAYNRMLAGLGEQGRQSRA